MDALESFNQIISLKKQEQSLENEMNFSALTLSLSHILCIGGKEAQKTASAIIIETNPQKLIKHFIASCATKNGELNDSLKRNIIKTSGLNNYFAQELSRIS